MNPDQPQPPSLIRRFRKKPVVIEAIQFTAEHLNECVAFCGGEYEYRTASQCAPFGEVLHIKTLEGTMTAVLGDWIIKGVKGEFYPCKPDILGATYESTDLAPTPNVSETPRTDAALVDSILCTEGGDEECTVYPCVEHVESDFCRQLERELAAVTKERDELKEDNDYRRTEMSNVWEMVQKISPWQESNDMNWSDEISCGLNGIAEQLTAALARAEKAEEALRPLAAIADAWDANKLDDDARKHYGVNLEFTNTKNHDEIELYTGRGGRRLLTLADCLIARAALTPTKEPAP